MQICTINIDNSFRNNWKLLCWCILITPLPGCSFLAPQDNMAPSWTLPTSPSVSLRRSSVGCLCRRQKASPLRLDRLASRRHVPNLRSDCSICGSSNSWPTLSPHANYLPTFADGRGNSKSIWRDAGLLSNLKCAEVVLVWADTEQTERNQKNEGLEEVVGIGRNVMFLIISNVLTLQVFVHYLKVIPILRMCNYVTKK